MITNPQKICLILGRSGCYVLSICKLAEDILGCYVDPLIGWAMGRRVSIIAEDATVNDAGQLLSVLTSQGWTCHKAGPGHELPLDYVCKPGEREILRYERPAEPGDTASTDRAHFVTGDGKGVLIWDPYGDSRTVKVGKVVSKRIFRRVG